MPANGGFSNVDIPGGFSEGELKRSYWWVTHREQVRKAAIGAFIAVDAVLVMVGAWGFIDFLALGGVREEAAIRQMTASFPVGTTAPPVEIRVQSPIVLPAGTGRYDFVMPVENPNPDAWVELTYKFTAGGIDTPERRGFILPGESKYLYELGYQSDGSPGAVQPFVVRRVFHRLDRHQIPEYAAWAEPRLGLRADNAQYFPPDPQASAQASRTTFTLVNDTPYAYNDADLRVHLYRGGSLVAVNLVHIDTFRSGEARPLELFWYQTLPQITRVEVVPDINIFDPNVYGSPI